MVLCRKKAQSGDRAERVLRWKVRVGSVGGSRRNFIYVGIVIVSECARFFFSPPTFSKIVLTSLLSIMSVKSQEKLNNDINI